MSGADGRLFIAIEVPGPIRGAFVSLREELRREAPSARWVRPEGMHLTLKFLGRTPRALIPGIDAALSDVASASAPFRLATGATGVFGSARRPRVLWLALEGDVEASVALAGAVDAALAPLGVPAEERPFRPHLTLARFATGSGDPLPDPARASLERALSGRPVPVDAIALFETLPASGGVRYESLRTHELRGRAPARAVEAPEA